MCSSDVNSITSSCDMPYIISFSVLYKRAVFFITIIELFKINRTVNILYTINCDDDNNNKCNHIWFKIIVTALLS